MPRNLDNRVELCVPIHDPAVKADLLDTLERCLADNTHAWELRRDGTWERLEPDDEPRDAQRELMELHQRRAAETTPHS